MHVLTGDMDLKVNNVDAFVNSAEVKTAVQAGIATSVGVATDKVVIESITQVVRRLSGEERRLASGTVKAKYKITDVAKEIDPATIPSLGTQVKDNTNAALKQAGKASEAVTEPAVAPAPVKKVVPKPMPTTTKPATTTGPQFYTELKFDVVLEVDDTDVFLTNTDVVTSLESAVASLLEVPNKDVTVESIALVTATGRRLKGAQGKVKPAIKVKDPTNKLTPAKAQGIAPKLPAAANKNLKTKGVPGKVGKATVATPTATKKPTKKPDPCKVVVAPPVVVKPAPVNPCAPVVAPAPVAPVNPCAPVVKSSQDAEVQVAAAPSIPSMLWLVVPGLFGMALVVHKVRRRQSSTRAVTQYTNMDSESADGLE
jgi:hypothetical protein